MQEPAMKNIAVVFASRKGQTRRVAEYIRWNLQDRVNDVTVIDLGRLGKHDLPDQTDGIIVGGPIYVGHFPRKLVRWIRNHHAQLHEKPSAFFSVSLNAADQRTESRRVDDELLQGLIESSGWVPDYIASFAGAVKYREYSWPIRKVMVQRSAMAQGPTDTEHDYEFTNWKQVDRFLDDFVGQTESSAFATRNRLASESSVNQFMPEFEHFWRHDIEVDAPPADVFQALKDMNPNDMRLARVLARVRTFGRREEQTETFAQAAEKFGNVTLVNQPPRRLVAGLVGQFWKPNFGIRQVAPDSFARFEEPGYTKVLTSFHIEPLGDGDRSKVHTEMRTFSTSTDAARRFNVYWALLNPGIKLYMRSMLNALEREATAQAA
jgi:menaquinone-dependent protoporphyrinogen oxidase